MRQCALSVRSTPPTVAVSLVTRSADSMRPFDTAKTWSRMSPTAFHTGAESVSSKWRSVDVRGRSNDGAGSSSA